MIGEESVKELKAHAYVIIVRKSMNNPREKIHSGRIPPIFLRLLSPTLTEGNIRLMSAQDIP